MDELVSILMCVHNECREYLNMAVQSMCRQTYRNIEILLVDDFSDSECKAEIARLKSLFPDVIKVIENSENLGITASLNAGLRQCSGKYIARMDADDFSHPERIERQVAFLDKYKEIDIVGCGVITFGAKNVYYSPAFGMDDDHAKCNLLFSSTLCHPGVMIRHDFLRLNHLMYDEAFKKAQDYEMWERCSMVGKLAVMSDVLLFYRMHDKQISSMGLQSQTSFADDVRKRRLQRLGIAVSEKDYDCHLCLGGGKSVDVKDLLAWSEKIRTANYAAQLMPEKTLRSVLHYRAVEAKYRAHGLRGLSLRDLPTFVSIVKSRATMATKLKNKTKELQQAYNQLEQTLL